VSPAFLVIAGALAAGAVVLLLLPLLRRREGLRPSTLTATVLACVLVIGGGALYAVLSQYDWARATPVTDTPAAMTARLARRLAREPNDLPGWLRLGKSYMELEQFPLAARAYQRADAMSEHRSVEALMGLAESMIAQDEEQIAGEAGKLFDRILELEPQNLKALFYGGYAALARGDGATGRARFDAMLRQPLPDNIRAIVEKQLATIDAALAQGGAAQQSSSAPAAGEPQVRVRITVSPKLKYQLTAESALFVLARDPAQPGPPFAAKRLPIQLPVEVTLSAADAMMPQRRISAGQTLEVVARISLSGQPQSTSGDPFGQVSYHVGKDGQLNLVIDRLAP
jgi:cytochrome c-type biogenesis protein CcmH